MLSSIIVLYRTVCVIILVMTMALLSSWNFPAVLYRIPWNPSHKQSLTGKATIFIDHITIIYIIYMISRHYPVMNWLCLNYKWINLQRQNWGCSGAEPLLTLCKAPRSIFRLQRKIISLNEVRLVNKTFYNNSQSFCDFSFTSLLYSLSCLNCIRHTGIVVQVNHVIDIIKFYLMVVPNYKSVEV